MTLKTTCRLYKYSYCVKPNVLYLTIQHFKCMHVTRTHWNVYWNCWGRLNKTILWHCSYTFECLYACKWMIIHIITHRYSVYLKALWMRCSIRFKWSVTNIINRIIFAFIEGRCSEIPENDPNVCFSVCTEILQHVRRAVLGEASPGINQMLLVFQDTTYWNIQGGSTASLILHTP